MPQRNFPTKTEVQIEKEKDERVVKRIERETERSEYYRKRDMQLVEDMAVIIQEEKRITEWSLFELMKLTVKQSYNIQRMCRSKFNKTIFYDKKVKEYYYENYVPKIEIKQKIQRLEKEITV